MRLSRARQLLIAAIASFGLTAVTHGQYRQPELGSVTNEKLPYSAGEVGVDEKLGTVVPDDLTFTDEEGQKITLGSFLNKDRPLILWLGYYECPMLCDKMSGGMVDAVKAVQLDAGKEFAIINVSIDPNESAGLAKAKKATYLKELGQPGNAAAWNLLTGSPQSIKTLADAVGYKYKQVEVKGTRQFAHPAVLVILSPGGKVTRYLFPEGDKEGVTFDSRTMQLSLVEAGEGKVGSLLDRVTMTCLMWDSRTGKYTKNAVRLMQFGGAATVAIMAIVFVPLWIRAARTRDPAGDDGNSPGGPMTPLTAA